MNQYSCKETRTHKGQQNKKKSQNKKQNDTTQNAKAKRKDARQNFDG